MSINLSDFCPKCTGKNLVEHLSPATARLLHSTGLEPWEKKFLKIVVSRNRSKAEEIVVQAIAKKVNPATVGRGTG